MDFSASRARMRDQTIKSTVKPHPEKNEPMILKSSTKESPACLSEREGKIAISAPMRAIDAQAAVAGWKKSARVACARLALMCGSEKPGPPHFRMSYPKCAVEFDHPNTPNLTVEFGGHDGVACLPVCKRTKYISSRNGGPRVTQRVIAAEPAAKMRVVMSMQASPPLLDAMAEVSDRGEDDLRTGTVFIANTRAVCKPADSGSDGFCTS